LNLKSKRSDLKMSDWGDEETEFESNSRINDDNRFNSSVTHLLSNLSVEVKQENNNNQIDGDQQPTASIKIKQKNMDINEMDDNNNISTKAQLSFLTKIMRKNIAESKNTVEVLRRDPNSPLHSVKSFDQLHIPEKLLKGIYSMGFQKPSKIQETMLPLLMAKPYQNCIAQSQSGTGKTAAFLISSLKRIEESMNVPQVLILCPTLELAMQTADVARHLAEFTNIKIRHIVKGEIRPTSELNEHMLVGTPGKVLDWIFRFRSFDVKRVKVFILDEADVMIDLQGHRQQSMKVQQELDKDCQLLLFSATYEKEVLEFAECIINDPIIITLRREEEVLDNLVQFYAHCANEDEKYNAVADIFGSVIVGSTIIFTQTKKSAIFLKEKLEKDGHKIAFLTGDLTADERLSVIQSFREGEERVLITTNVASRGLDIEQVTLVVNYDLPFDVFKKDIDFEVYLHRIGRCGRFGKPGFAISLIDASRQQELDQIKKIEDHFKKPIPLLKTSDVDQFEGWE